MLPQLVARLRAEEQQPLQHRLIGRSSSTASFHSATDSDSQAQTEERRHLDTQKTLYHQERSSPSAPPPSLLLPTRIPKQRKKKINGMGVPTRFFFAVCLVSSLPQPQSGTRSPRTTSSGLRERLLNETYSCSFCITGNSTGTFQTEGFELSLSSRRILRWAIVLPTYPTVNARSLLGPGSRGGDGEVRSDYR